MKCPVQLARDLSAEGGGEVGHSASGRQNATIPRNRLGAGHESAGSNSAGDGEAGYLVASGRDLGNHGPEYATLEKALRVIGYDGLLDRRRGKPSPKRVRLE